MPDSTPSSVSRVDLVVLGGGSGGYAAALRLAELGGSVVLVEQDRLGGTCLHRGCIPTKALLHAAEIADTARTADSHGIRASFDGVDTAKLHRHRHEVVDRLWKGLSGLVGGRGIEVVHGRGHLIGPHTVQVGERRIDAAHVLLATGSAPRVPEGIAADGVHVLTSDDALRMERIPASAIVLGAGAIGMEFASAWRSLGAEVTVVEAADRLLPAEEPRHSRLIERAYRRRGIGFRVAARVTDVKVADHGVTVTLGDGATLDAEVLLVAVGRAPVSDGLGYAEAGVDLDRGHVVVDALCRTNVPSISAVGDLIATPQLAHVGFAEGILVAERLAGLTPAPVDYDNVPRVTYSSPEVASVGLTSTRAEQLGHDVVTQTYDLAGNGKALILGASGAVTVVAGRGGRVLGVHMIGDRVGELIAEAQLIVNWEARADEVAALIHPHPTLSEAIGEAHLALAGKPLHAHA
ncbi:MAG: dihydrolipoyl dehydrogenase [Streptomycetaceae bacterium]|nr:dihydrolipoyl dehydrogenase [Streptomycetaceae bacterium]